MGYVEWFPGVSRGITLVDGHPGTKGPMFLQVKMLPCSQGSYGLCLDGVSCGGPGSGRSEDVG